MSYEEILEKINKAKALAASKKVEAGIQDKDIKKLEKIPKAQDPKPSNHQYRSVVEDWSKPSDLAPDGKTFLDLFPSRWATDQSSDIVFIHSMTGRPWVRPAQI